MNPFWEIDSAHCNDGVTLSKLIKKIRWLRIDGEKTLSERELTYQSQISGKFLLDAK